MRVLENAGSKTAGAGRDAQQAAAPAVLNVPGTCRVLVFAFGSSTSGIPREWVASGKSPGVNLLPDLSEESVQKVAALVERHAGRTDLVVLSVHWGSNWGYGIPQDQIDFAHRLIDRAGVDVVHGHSSHHVKGLEIYKGRLILYGCGDFLNDYEGISGEEEYRSDLTSLSDVIMQRTACGAAFGCILAKVFLHQSPRKSRAPTSATVMPLACP